MMATQMADGKHDVTGQNSLLLVSLSSVSCQQEDLLGQELHDSSGKNASSGTASHGVAALSELCGHAGDRECEVAAR